MLQLSGRPAIHCFFLFTFFLLSVNSIRAESDDLIFDFDSEKGPAPSWTLVINEVVSSNSDSALDPDFNESGDWVEIYNAGPDAADLTGLALSDDATAPAKWVFPNGSSLAAEDYLLIWCDDYDTVSQAFHTNFRISAGGESVILYDTNSLTIIDSTDVPALETDQAWARVPDGTGEFEKTITPTPDASNVAASRGAAPDFSMGSGVYDSSILVAMMADGATETRYTLDGSEPTQASALYTSPIAISSTTGLRAKAWYADQNPSDITSATYLFGMPADRQIPIISIVMDPSDFSDIYANFEERGRAWERLAHVAVISPDSSVVDETDAGLRIHGGFSRSSAKKSLRFYFRSDYGNADWSLPWMQRSPNDSFEQLVLRASGNDGFLVTVASQLNEASYIRDQMLRDLYAEQGHFAADGFFGALYVNGQYWGLYNATERISNDTMKKVYGPDDWDIVKGTWTFPTKFYTEATDGDLAAWNDFLTWHISNDLSTDTDFNELKNRIEYENFIDWMALNISVQNEDWPHNNWIASRARNTPDAKFTFHEWDAEWGLGLRPQGWQSDSLNWAQGNNFHNYASQNGFIAPLSNLFNGNDLNRTGSNPVVNGVLDHPQGERDFITAVENFLNFDFATNETLDDFNHYVSILESEIPREANRWAAFNGLRSESQLNAGWPVAVQNLRNFITNRPAVMRSLVVNEFGLSGTRTITFTKSGNGDGVATINGHAVQLPWTGIFFDGSLPDLIAVPASGSTFTGWSGAVTSANAQIQYSVSSGGGISINLQFDETLAEGPKANDVIINEYWVNDNSATYQIGEIEGDWIELLVIKDGINLQGYRLTDNPTVASQNTIDDGEGSLILPELPVLENVPAGTIILILASKNTTNSATFPTDDLDLSDKRLVFVRDNGNLDDTTDPGFGLGTNDQSVALVAPGNLASFADDIGIDFIAEGTRVTPASFFIASSDVVFGNPFSGIGQDDGAVFLNDAMGGWNNDDGEDSSIGDFLPGNGGWVVDPLAQFTGDEVTPQPVLLTPGYPNTGQTVPNTDIDVMGVYWLFH